MGNCKTGESSLKQDFRTLNTSLRSGPTDLPVFYQHQQYPI